MSDKVTGVTIVSVTPTTVNTKRGPAQKHTIVLASGAELQTFKHDLAQTAASLVGQPVDIDYEVNVNGDFTNFYPTQILPSANPALQAQMAQTLLGGSIPGGQLAAQVVTTAAPQASLIAGDYSADPKTLSIHRQVAAKVSAALGAATPQEFWANVEALVVYFASGATPILPDLEVDPDADIPF